MSKKYIILIISTLILAVAIFFRYNAKIEYEKSVNQIKADSKEIMQIGQLQNLWSAKGMHSKIKSAISFVTAKKVKVDLKRSKAVLSFANLTDRELNRLLGKLASLPVRFNSLNIKRDNKTFSLECLCVW